MDSYFNNVTSYVLKIIIYLSYYSLHCSSFSGPATESMYSGVVTESNPLEQSMPAATNQVSINPSRTKNHQQDRNVNNVSLLLKRKNNRNFS